MQYSIIAASAILLYVIASVMLFKRIYGNTHAERISESLPTGKSAILILAAIALLFHGWALYLGLFLDNSLNLGFTSALSLVIWVIAILFIIASMTRPVENLGILVLPFCVFIVVVNWIIPSPDYLIPNSSWLRTSHLMIAIIAYGLLGLAVAQAILLSFQERHLHNKQPSRLLHTLPPVQTMESLLFQMITLGFIFLTFTLTSGTLFSKEIFGKPISFTHHTIFAICAWIIFGTLLLGHWVFGWRGKTAVRWTIGGFVLLVLAYFGSRFVAEFLL